MDLRVAVYSLAEEIKGVLLRLGTEEVETLSRADLHALEVYCYLSTDRLRKRRRRSLARLFDCLPSLHSSLTKTVMRLSILAAHWLWLRTGTE